MDILALTIESLRLTWIEAEDVFKQDKREKTLNLHNAIAHKFWKRFKLFRSFRSRRALIGH